MGWVLCGDSGLICTIAESYVTVLFKVCGKVKLKYVHCTKKLESMHSYTSLIIYIFCEALNAAHMPHMYKLQCFSSK